MRELLHNFLWGFTGERQCMVVEDGKVISREPDAGQFVGLVQNLPKTQDSGLRTSAEFVPIDLSGRHLLPSFIDSHCHILPTGLDLQKLSLDGCTSHEEMLDLVRRRESELDDGEWLMAVHYDQTRFPNGEHANRDQLDSISRIRPIVLRHVNGHASVVNGACLERAGVHEGTRDPKGGKFDRDASGKLTGVLLERAHEIVTSAAKTPSLPQMVDAILQAGERMSDLGISCGSDMMTGRYDLESELEAYRLASERGCKVRLRLYLQWATLFGPRALPAARLNEHVSQMDAGRCKISGVKIFADGAIGSATAGIYGNFEGSSSDGQLIYQPERLKNMVRTAHEAGYQLAIHSIGDRSTDLVMDAFSALDHPERHRIEHAMILSDAQIERMAKLGIHCSMQPEFLMRFGHSYRRQLGEGRARLLNRFRSVLDAGIPLSFNSDRPITGGDPWDGIRTAERRPEGFAQDENVTRCEAIYAYTAKGAAANGDGAEMGSLTPGQFADFRLWGER